MLAVYTGSSLTGLTKIGSNDDESNPNVLTSKVEFDAVPGTAYHIAVDGFKEANQEVARGLVNVHLAQQVTATHQLSVAKSGTGTGTVSSSPAGIDCGASCTAAFAGGTQVTLTATAGPDSTFTGWSGACSGSTATCNVTMDAAKAVTATFTQAAVTHTLTVSKGGTGGGTVTSSPAGISCGSTCSVAFAAGAQVTLSVQPTAGSSFTGWSGACSGSGGCVVTMDAAKSVTATFTADPVTHQLTVTKTGPGTVTSEPAGINCGATCSSSFAEGTGVTLTAAAATGATFTGWGGACSGSAATCSLTLNEAKDASATFVAGVPVNDAFVNAIALTGTSGQQTASNVGATKEIGEPNHAGDDGGASVWYSITPAATGTLTLDTRGSGFDTLLGVYSGTTVQLLLPVASNDDEQYPAILTSKLVVVVHAGVTYRIAVDGYNLNGAGAESGPLTIRWEAVADTTAPLNPALSSTSHLPGVASADNTVDMAWNGAGDAGTGVDGFSYHWDGVAATAPDLSKDAEEHATATTSPSLAPGAYYFHLRTRDNAGHWSDPVHAGPYIVVVATPPPPPPSVRHRLQVTKAGAGSGIVTGTPGGIACGAVCSADYDAGTAVTINATPNRGSRFAGWSGACSGSLGCAVTMGGAKAVTATFVRTTVLVCRVPNVRRQTLAAARRALTRAHCATGRVGRVYSSSVRKGRVISQSRRPGARLARGTRVNLLVSRGRRPRR